MARRPGGAIQVPPSSLRFIWYFPGPIGSVTAHHPPLVGTIATGSQLVKSPLTSTIRARGAFTRSHSAPTLSLTAANPLAAGASSSGRNTGGNGVTLDD